MTSLTIETSDGTGLDNPGKRSLRIGPRNEITAAIWATSAAIKPGVKYKIQGRRRSVGVKSTRRDLMGWNQGNLWGVVMDLEHQ